ncbi:MAG: hypothetical protein ACLTBU_06915 [Zhenhengia sp.]|uniref:hypothetical protein n=1 Tax=Zhenhengia sp. TaxID=2944208 RepID=UPI003993FAB6
MENQEKRIKELEKRCNSLEILNKNYWTENIKLREENALNQEMLKLLNQNEDVQQMKKLHLENEQLRNRIVGLEKQVNGLHKKYNYLERLDLGRGKFDKSHKRHYDDEFYRIIIRAVKKHEVNGRVERQLAIKEIKNMAEVKEYLEVSKTQLNGTTLINLFDQAILYVGEEFGLTIEATKNKVTRHRRGLDEKIKSELAEDR